MSREAVPGSDAFRSSVRLPVPAAQAPGAYQIDIGAMTREGRPLAVKNMELVELLPTQGSVLPRAAAGARAGRGAELCAWPAG